MAVGTFTTCQAAGAWSTGPRLMCTAACFGPLSGQVRARRHVRDHVRGAGRRHHRAGARLRLGRAVLHGLQGQRQLQHLELLLLQPRLWRLPQGHLPAQEPDQPVLPQARPGALASRAGACHVPSWREGKLGRAWQCPQLAGVPACACVAGKCGARAIPTRHALLAAHASYARSKQSPCWCWSVCAASGAYEWGGAHASVRRRRRANP